MMDNICQSKKTSKSKQGSSKIDPSFKSKRYRDKLRTEVKALESLIPVDRPALHRKLDSQTVYRLVIAFLRMKNYFKSIDIHENQSRTIAEHQTTSDVTSRCRQLEEQLFKEIDIVELVEGFILMLSVDGTIMYVSENIVHFNGFNQVDLIHRCIYGIIHPDDQIDVRNILEQNGQYSYHNQMGVNNARKVQKMTSYKESSVTISFFCRLKCFVGNTAGYMKLHCSGQLLTAQNIQRSSKTSDRVAILYCQPFIYNGNDVMNEPKDKVFWSKHDLDLTFRETEDKITDILGYSETELSGVSMYQLVDADDLFTLVNVHKSMTEVSDVQSFFIRLKHKDSSWTWLHSKGKVISKNSKKFSIVFTHCPIRDENSAFLQQEMQHRRKHGFNDLISFSKFECNHDNYMTETEDFCITERKYNTNGPYCCKNHNKRRKTINKYGMESLEYDRDCCDGRNEEVSVILNPMTFIPVQCPSTWHTNTDRHSPVVPSSHVAHKLCVKEKQLQYAQFKRSQKPLRISQQYSDHDLPCNSQVFYNDHHGYTRNIVCQDRNTDLYRQSLYLYNIGPVIQQQTNTPYTGQDMVKVLASHNRPYHLSELYNYPPSPPPSPRRYFTDTIVYPSIYNGVYQNNTVLQDNSSFTVTQAPLNSLFADDQNQKESGVGKNKSYAIGYSDRATKLSDSKPLQQYQSRANIKFSMVLNSPIASNYTNYNSSNDKDYSNNINGHHGQSVQYLNLSNNLNKVSANQIKHESRDSQSCSMQTGSQLVKPPHNCVHYDVEASIHMKIVESELKTSQSYNEVEIPTFDSFMDYLTDEKVY